jgi:glycine dehydrogenase subunit 1
LCLLGREGFVELARNCAANATYALQRLSRIPGVRRAFDRPFFNEFALVLPRDASEVVGRLLDHGIAAGFPVSRYYRDMDRVLLLAFTEKRTKEEIEILAARLESALT